MPSKRSKMTADKARERIVSLEESVIARGQRLEQLRARISRATQPEDKLLAARERLERRLELEQEQIHKLRRLLSRMEPTSREDSEEFVGSEEIDDLHRSFEEVKQDLSQVKMRLESSDLPRDLPTRLTSFEERINRREEVDSDLFTQILGLQNALDSERLTVRKLSRRIREQDKSIDALREAVEDSVVATVDLAERLEELEDNMSETQSPSPSSQELDELRQALLLRLSKLSERIDAQADLLEELCDQDQEPTDDRFAELESMMKSLDALGSRMDLWQREKESEPKVEAATETAESVFSPPPFSPDPEQEAPSVAIFGDKEGWIPAKFDNDFHNEASSANFANGPASFVS